MVLTYWILAALGANLLGAGIVILFHANNLKLANESFKLWFGTGTLGLLFYVGGNCLLLDAAKNLFL